MNLENILKDVWDIKEKRRIVQALNDVASLYGLKTNEVLISRQEINPQDVWVAAKEECDLKVAEELTKTKYKNNLPSLITLLEYQNKKIIYIGSNRSLVFTLKGKNPDSIVFKLPDRIKEPILFKEAKISVLDIIKENK